MDNLKDIFLQNRSTYFENAFDHEDLASVIKIMNLDYAAFKGILSTYTTVEIIDLTTDTYIDLGCLDYVKKLMDGITSTQGVLNQVVEYLVSPEFQEEAAAFYDMSTLPERLRAGKTLSIDYNGSVGGWLRSQIIPLTWQEDGRGKEAIVTVQRLYDNKREVARLRKLSVTDGLSGLYNRAGGEEQIRKFFQDGVEGMLCLMDIDDFKKVNDRYGHRTGDEVIRKISDCMKNVFRKNDLLIRIGGDEFLIFCPHVSDRETGESRIQEFMHSVEKLRFEGMENTVSISVGVIFCSREQPQTYDEAFQSVDVLMYECKEKKKRNRKNQCL